MHKETDRKKVIILGIDGMDPKITEQLIQEGRLPNFSYLKTKGYYSHLATTIPNETVVAWASFITGLDPGGHGIFDFVMRDPKRYLPYLSLNEVSMAWNKPKIQLRRKGEAFWSILSRNNIPSYIYFCPNTFPPEAILGRMISGMGVPDITGTMGRFSFYTTKPLSEEDKESRGKIIYVNPNSNVIDTQIYGPKISANNLISESTIPLRLVLYSDKDEIKIEFQKKDLHLKKDTWSDWQKMAFRISLFKKVYGIGRFYLKSIEPDLELYLSPINFDPERPLFPISYPKDYSVRLAKRIGLYYTQGMPHDTWALSEGRIDEKAYLELTDEILQENEKILNEGLKEFKRGIFFFYLETLDMVQHMFWRYLDELHPLHQNDPLYKDTIFKYYEKIDHILGEILKKIDEDTTAIVLSDHGFGPFRRSVHLNRWLLEHGYLSLKEGTKESREFFEDIDWSKTKAYALGFGGIYLNKIGREYYGIVAYDEEQNLKQDIAKGLEQLKDPQSGEMVIKKVYFKEDIFQGPYINDAPDLFVGFNLGYRASWQTALGGVPASLIEDNKKKWSGDHLVDSHLVPGVLFMNKKIELKEPSIIDIAPTVLGLFNIDRPKEIQGKFMFKDENK